MVKKYHWLELGIGLIFFIISLRMIIDGFMTKQNIQDRYDDGIEHKFIKKIGAGFLSGLLPGLFGIGTGAVLVPIFIYTLKSSIKTAIGSSLVCFSVNAGISSMFKLIQGFVLLDKALIICMGTLLGAYWGAQLNQYFPSAKLKIIFGILFLYIAFKYILLFWGIGI